MIETRLQAGFCVIHQQHLAGDRQRPFDLMGGVGMSGRVQGVMR